MATPHPAAGWYADPQQPEQLRYWNGQTWTGQAQPVHMAVATASNGFAVTALVVGIVGVVCGLVPFLFFLAWILGVLGLVFGVLGRSRATKDPRAGKKVMATWGAALGTVAIALGVVGIVIVNNAVDHVSKELNGLSDCIDNADTAAEINDC